MILLYSVIMGYVYFEHMNNTLPKDSNCSFVASVYTDIVAFLVGGYLAYFGATRKAPLVEIIGTAIIVEHALQLFYNKRLDRQSFRQIDHNIIILSLLMYIRF